MTATHLRRTLLAGITMLLASLALSFSTPREAQAAFAQPTTVASNHVGWVNTRAITVTCKALLPQCLNPQHTAYRWTGSSWQTTTIGQETKVYVYPYSSPWHWIWTQQTGWLAIQNSDLTLGYYCSGSGCTT